MAKELKLDTIHQGDCVALMRRMGEASVDLAFADPPFNIGYDYDVYDDRQEHTAYLDWSQEWISGVHRVLKPTGTFWLAIGDEYAAELKVLSQQVGFHCRSWVIWYYTFGVNCKNKFSRSHAHLFHFVKDPAAFTFHADEIRIPSARQLVYADARANPTGRLPDDTWVLRPQDLSDRFSAEEDTWYFPRVAGTFKERAGFHGCQMPEQLLGRILRACSKPGDVVLDPFAGSATTLAVAKKLGRRYLGLELSKDYVQRGSERLQKIRCGDRLEGAPEPLISAKNTPQTPLDSRKSRKEAGIALQKALGSEAGEIERSQQLGEEVLLSAFTRCHQGYSVDRVIADPKLNEAFVEECQSRQLPGGPRDWNWSLFRLRKMGRLANVQTTERTQLKLDACEPFLFASEIALRQMDDAGHVSIDEILCDPALAEEFDRLAKKFAPGYSSFEYRWGALRLRKEARVARNRAWALKPVQFPRPRPLKKIDWLDISSGAGVYSVSTRKGKEALFVGEATNLREQLKARFSSKSRKSWQPFADELELATFPASLSFTDLLGYRTQAVQKMKPRLNLLNLASE